MTLKDYMAKNCPAQPDYTTFYLHYLEAYRELFPNSTPPRQKVLCIIFDTYYKTPAPPPAPKFEIGAILEHSWGFEQTNIDFYCIGDRVGEWVTIKRMGKHSTPMDSNMTTLCTPTTVDGTAKPIRKKIKILDGKESGFSLESGGWVSLWDGKPSRATHYA